MSLRDFIIGFLFIVSVVCGLVGLSETAKRHVTFSTAYADSVGVASCHKLFKLAATRAESLTVAVNQDCATVLP